MNLLIIGDYPVATQARMRAAFPTEWQITIAAPDACAPYLADAEVVIPEHVLVDDAFLAQAPRLRFVQVGAVGNHHTLRLTTIFYVREEDIEAALHLIRC